MKKFEYTWVESVWYSTTIEANTQDEADELFDDGQIGTPKQIDSYFEEVTSVKEIE